MSPGKLTRRIDGTFKGRALAKASMTLALALVLILSFELPMAKADIYSCAPPYSGKYESGEWNAGYEQGLAWANSGRTWFNLHIDCYWGSVIKYVYAGFYIDVYIPSDAAIIDVKAALFFKKEWSGGRELPGLWIYFYPSHSGKWAGVWFKAAIDSIPPVEAFQGNCATVYYITGTDGEITNYRVDYEVKEALVSIYNPPPGNHRIYFGLVVGARAERRHVWPLLQPDEVDVKSNVYITSVKITIVRRTSLTVTVSPNLVYANQQITISGQLTTQNGQGLEGQTVILSYYGPDYKFIGSTTTVFEGRYSYNWRAPSSSGTYTVEAYYPGSVDLLPSRAAMTLTVQQADFAVSVSPSSATAYLGQEVSTMVYVNKDPEWPYTVSLSVSGGSINPSSEVPDFSATWTISAPSSPGTYTYTVTASSRGVIKQAIFTLTVQQPQEPPYDFKVSISPDYVEVDPNKPINVSVVVSPGPQYPYTVSLSATSGSANPSSGRPYFTATWTLTAPGAPGDYTYRVTGHGGDGKVRYADLYVKVKAASPADYWQGYVKYTNHYYVVDDLRLEARFVSPIDWELEHEGPSVKTMRKGDKDSWSPPNKLAFGDFFAIDAYVELREHISTTTQVIDKYYYNGAWHDNPPSNGNFKGYAKYDEKHNYYSASVTVTGSLPKELFWTIDQEDPLNKTKYSDGGNFTISKRGLSGNNWVYLGSTNIFRVKSPKEAGVNEGSPRDVTITASYSWSNGKDSWSSSKSLTVRLSWIRPRVQQIWSSTFLCTIRVYGVWADDGSRVKGRPYLYYGLDLDGSKRFYLKTGMASNGDSYAEGDPVDPQSLRPTGYVVSKVTTIPATPAIEDFALMKASVEYRELAIAVYQRDGSGIKLKVYEFKEPYNSMANAKVTLVIKDLSSGRVRELTEMTDPQGYAYFARSELSLPKSYELWAVAWGASADDVIYGRSPFGCVLLERCPTA